MSEKIKKIYDEWKGPIVYIIILILLFGSLAGAGIIAGIAIERGETIFSNR